MSSFFGISGGSSFSMTSDSDGNIYTANASRDNVSKITPAGISSIIGTTGGSPSDIVVDSAGRIYTTNGRDNNVTVITPTVFTVAQPTTILNTSITDTTINITTVAGITASDVSVDPTTTAGTSALSCAQVNTDTVNCTVSIDSSGDLVIAATNSVGTTNIETVTGYVIDTVNPAVPTVSIDTVTSGVSNPIVNFSATDNIAIDYFEIDYIEDNAGAGVGSTVTTISPVSSPSAALSLDPDALTSGDFVHEIIVRAFDTAGNHSEITLRFPPIITFNTPATVNNTDITGTTVTVTSPQDNDIASVTFDPGTTGSTLGTCTDENSGTTAPYASPVTCLIGTITTSGSIELVATDDFNGAVANNSQSFTIETVLPEITVTPATKISKDPISDTTISVTDNHGIDAGDVNLSVIQTVGGITLSNSNCVQTNSSQVDCTATIDTEGVGNLVVSATDLAGNAATATEINYEIDTSSPVIPVTPNLQDSSDTGSSNTDNLTNDDTPTFSVVCTEAGRIDLFLDGANSGTYTCNGTETILVTASSQTDGTYAITVTATDSLGNESAASSALSITIDTTINETTINTPTNSQPASGQAEPNSSVVISSPSGSICVTTTNGAGSYFCTLSPVPVDGENITAVATDVYGNTDSETVIGGIDTVLPANPTVNQINPGDTTITGVGDDDAVITLDIGVCLNAPVIVTGGIWTCDIAEASAPNEGDQIIATATDSAGNISTAEYNIPIPSSGSSATRVGTRSITSSEAGSARADFLARIAELRALIETLTNERYGASSVIQQQTNGTTTNLYPRDLEIGVSGSDVTRLQKHLMSQGFAIPAGPTGDFITQTESALILFQKQHNIVPAVGYFGPVTRAFVLEQI